MTTPATLSSPDLVNQDPSASPDDEAVVAALYLKISGMSCAGCASSVGNLLQRIPGVDLADVNFAAEQARVIFHPQQVSPPDLIAAVQQGGFGAAPLAEAQTEDPEAETEAQIQAAWRRFWLAAIPAGILMTVMLVCMVLGLPHNQHHRLLTLALAFPVVFIAGWPTHRASGAALRRGSPNMDVLISLSTLPTYLVGFLGIAEVTVFVEVAAMVMAFHLLSRYLERRARGRASQAIRHLIGMQARQAHLQRVRDVSAGSESTHPDSDAKTDIIDVPIEVIQVGDRVLVRPGERIPCDGRVVEGHSAVDESMATGESMPMAKQAGSEVIGGSLNQAGALVVEVTRTGADTFLAQMVRLIQEAQGSKVPIQTLADRVTSYFVPSVVVLALLTLGIWYVESAALQPWLTEIASVLPWVRSDLSPLSLAAFNMIAVLVVACPCALGLATPIALMVGSGRGAEQGILLRRGEAIQTLKSVQAIVLDKTGTLTQGKPQVTAIVADPQVDLDLENLGSPNFWDRQQQTLLIWAAAVEQGSEHPLGRAIFQCAQRQALSIPIPTDIIATPGQGIQGLLTGLDQPQPILVGNPAFLLEHDLDLSPWLPALDSLESQGQTVVGVAVDRKVLGLIALADTLKPEAASVVAQLKRRGLDPIMLTGDSPRVAAAIAAQVGIQQVFAQVLPADKVQRIRDLQAQGQVVAMVGDGLNDAPALTQADVGIAIGTGTELAIEAADLALVSGDLQGLIRALDLSQHTFAKIRQNLAWAYGYNLLAIPLAATGLLHPIMAEIAMALSSLTVIWNSLQLRRIPLASERSGPEENS
ncbi:MAG: copper-translocating P-type ATPase [Synechococcaceae cyanobacterium SM2_3_2]|nr:copper-translocating P-type ATPase [Synechococcaceae cyanobacterium SM2_3_2]